jgi:hypothetical protein
MSRKANPAAHGDGTIKTDNILTSDLIVLLPDEDPQAIQDAVFDLESLGLVEIVRTIGKHWWLHLTQMFYEQVDHQVMGWNTYDDARTLAKLLLEDEARAATSKLHEISGWDKRRFNPAFRALLNHIPDERISKRYSRIIPQPICYCCRKIARG